MRPEQIQKASSREMSQPLSARVMIVDDEPAILFAYQKLIRANGFEIDVCEGLDEALNLVRAVSYFAVITDIRLSGSEDTEGLQLLQSVRKLQPKALPIVITGYGNSKVKQALMDLRVLHYFEKPVEPSLIIELLKATHKVKIEQEKNDSVSGFSLLELQ